MKTRFTQKFLMAFLMIGLFTTSQAQTYVNGAASGANDGSSWADAYTDLSAALGAATSGDVWVAAGTYVPADAGLDTFNTFLIMNPVNVYGGFAGTEASIDDRVDGNTTILSGDVDGDDMENVLTTNKEDNVYHVISIDVGATDVVILDGLTISGGAASFDRSSQNNYVYGGAGVWTNSTIEMNNCNVNNNSAALGAAVFIDGDANDSKITNTTVSTHSGDFGGAIFLSGGDGFVLDNNFYSNNSASVSGGVVYAGDVTNTTFSNSTFNGNSGQFGGALIHFDSNISIENCEFIENESSNLGGAIVSSGGEYAMSNCLLEDNTAVGNGGAIFEFGGAGNHTNNTFKGNSGASGGAINQQDGVHTYDGNIFDSNDCTNFGGAVLTGFNAQGIFINCVFEENESLNGPAGAIWTQNDTTSLTIDRTQFLGNNSGGQAGAIGIFGAVPITISNSFFSGNSAAGFGGAINGSEKSADEPGEATVTMTNSIFRENFTDQQGAGFSFVDFDVNITNCEFSANIGEGTGGAMSFNATDTSNVVVNITHSTIVSNFAVIGAGIASFTAETDSKLSITLTNTVLANPDGNNYEVEAGTPKFSSNGGNISSDDSTIGGFTNTNDMNEVDSDEIFEDIDDFIYLLTETSVAKDNGVDAGVPEDINGNARVDAPDSGAYECVDPDTSTEEVLENNGQLTMTPNPAATVSVITVDNAWNGVVNIIVTDMTGKVVANQNVNKSAQTQDFNLNVRDLSEGNYILTLRAEDAIVSTQFIKI